MLCIRILIAISALALALQPASADDAREISLVIDGTPRRAALVNDFGKGGAVPVVIVLHGGQGSAADQRERTGFDGLAVTEGFTVVYPEGTEWAPGRHAWNTGYLMRRQVGQSNDIAYLDALIDILIRDHSADPRRIYMTGGSNGAMMTLVYATQRAERLAAIARSWGRCSASKRSPADRCRSCSSTVDKIMKCLPKEASAETRSLRAIRWHPTNRWLKRSSFGSRPMAHSRRQ